MKAKKYETLIVQIWETFPIFCRFNSEKLTEAVVSLLKLIEPMVNENFLNLRNIALRALSELINHCRNTPVITE